MLPLGEEINSFTPVQHPANDMTTDIVTTHFDYHSIDHNLLKLDILGHDDPTMIKTLEEYISSPALENEYNETDNRFVATKIPLDDKGVMSLFHDTSALGIKPDDIGGCPVGCLGIPEFGTDFVVQMVVDTQPKTLSDLIRISGLSHGTDVWLNNAQELIKSGKATISTAICTRDDIMTYLINKGMDSELSFTIMEKVRKGKGLTDDFEKSMKEAGVPDWYIWSCKQIKYMFPKAHAAAYMISTLRLGWYKVHRPVEYYAAYFTVRGEDFDGAVVLQGREAVRRKMNEITMKGKEASKKEEDAFATFQIVNEMLARGIEVLPIDLYQSDARKYLVEDGKIRLPFASLSGVGEAAANSLAAARENGGPYISIDDLQTRSKVSKSVIEALQVAGALNGLPESSQMSLF